jgi:thioredoxin 1
MMKSPVRRYCGLALAAMALVFSAEARNVRSAEHGQAMHTPMRTRSPVLQTEPGRVMVYTTVRTSRVGRVNVTNFDREVLRSNKPVLVDFYADWCGPCRMLSPTLEELARETPQVKIVKVNIDESPSLAARYGVSSIPALISFRNGRPVAGRVGLVSKPQLQALLAP